MNCEAIEKYKGDLEAGLMKYMQNPINERSAAAVDSMIQCWRNINDMQGMIRKSFDFTPEKAEHWLMSMQNDDGSTGPHWTLDQTNAYKPEGVSEYCWECAMNMMYSDYYSVAIAYNVNIPEFYADLAKAFLFDKDAKSPKDKISAYYNCIVDVG